MPGGSRLLSFHLNHRAILRYSDVSMEASFIGLGRQHDRNEMVKIRFLHLDARHFFKGP
jgi:hypothetical protein